MFVTLIWVVLLSAIFILFMSSWLKWLKKITEPFWVKLLLPLIIATLFVLTHLLWIEWLLKWAQWVTQFSLNELKKQAYSFLGQGVLIQTFSLMFISLIPTLIAKLTEKPFRPFRPPYWSSIYLFISMALLMVIPYG